jgi:hypothetical protein
MGHPWKKRPGKQSMSDQEFWGVAYPLFNDGTIEHLVKAGKEQERIRRMKHDRLKLHEKNRLLKRKISEFYKQGEKNGKSTDL